MHKKNLPPERNGSNLFLIYPTSHSLHRFHASLSVTQPAFLVARECMRKESNIVFISYYPEDLPGLLTPSQPPPPYFTFLPVKTSTSRCCYLPGFQQPVTSTSFSLLQKLSPTVFLDALPAVPNTCWEAQPAMSNLEGKKKKWRNQHKGQSG